MTKRQKDIYNFIRDLINQRKYGPSVREIADEFKIKSPNGVICHLRALEKKGMITREAYASRSIQLTHLIDERGLPLAGQVVAGVMHEAIEQTKRANIGALFSKKGMFVLEVNDNRMIDQHIVKGDYIVMKKKRTVQDGDMVLVDYGEEKVLTYWDSKEQEKADSKLVGVLAGVVRRG